MEIGIAITNPPKSLELAVGDVGYKAFRMEAVGHEDGVAVSGLSID